MSEVSGEERKEALFPPPVYLKAIRLLPKGQAPDPDTAHLLPKGGRDRFDVITDNRFILQEGFGEKEGGFGIVKVGFDRNLQKHAAIKFLKPELFRELTKYDPDYIKLFYDEARRAANLEHHNIAKVYDVVVGTVHEQPTIGVAMEWLQPIPYEHPLPLQDAAKLASDIGAALDFAHSKGIVHQDVKPSNIMMRGNTDYVLTDFGSARPMAEKSNLIFITRDHADAHMNNPQTGDRLKERMDQYALAKSIAELISWSRISIVHDPKLFTLPATIPRSTRDVLMRAMDYHRENRYASCSEFAQAFEQSLHEPQVIEDIPKGIAISAIKNITQGAVRASYDVIVKEISAKGRFATSHTVPVNRKTKDGEIPITNNEIGAVQPIIIDIVDLLNMEADPDLKPDGLENIRSITEHLKVIYTPDIRPRNGKTIFEGTNRMVRGGDNIIPIVHTLIYHLSYAFKGSRGLDNHPDQESRDWQAFGEGLLQTDGEERAKYVINALKGTVMEDARKAYKSGNYARANELLLRFIATNPSLGIEVKIANNNGLVNSIINDGDESNPGVTRTISQFNDGLAKAICYGSVQDARVVYGWLKELCTKNKKAFILIDQQDPYNFYQELSHELNAWLISGFWYQNRGGDWRSYIPGYMSPEMHQIEGANRLLDKYYIPNNNQEIPIVAMWRSLKNRISTFRS